MIAIIRYAPSIDAFVVDFGYRQTYALTVRTAANIATFSGCREIRVEHDDSWPLCEADALREAIWAVVDIAENHDRTFRSKLRRKYAYPLQAKWLATQPDTPWTRQLRNQLSREGNYLSAAA